MYEELEARYLSWLHYKVVLEFAPNTSQSFYELFRILNSIEFVYSVTGDDNRAAYGKQLREFFCTETRSSRVPSWLDEPCSVLEMLVAFADEAEFNTETQRYIWFWRFMDNLKLSHLNDAVNPDAYSDVAPIIDRFLWRKYSSDGSGGLFPLRRPREDQRHVEIWYQFCAYVMENGYI